VHGPRCIEVAAELLEDADPKIRLAAAVALMDRGFGRPAQRIEGTENGTSVTALHLLAAQVVSEEIVSRMEQHAINGHAEPTNEKVTTMDLMRLPKPLE